MTRTWNRLAALATLAAAFGCAVIGKAEQDEVEAEREQEAAAAGGATGEPDLPIDAPEVDVPLEGFGDSAVASVADMAAEGIVILAIAALITSIVHLFRHRLPLLGFLTSAVAVVIAALAFLKAWG
jgi:hypothetical protein